MTETKTCRACLAEIPEAAVRCQQCGSDPRGPIDWGSPIRLASGTAVLIILAALFQSGGDGTAENISGALYLAGGVGLIWLVYDLFHLDRRPARTSQPTDVDD